MQILSRILLVSLVLTVATSPAAHAQVTPPALYFDTSQPVGATGKIQATGTYALRNPPHTFNNVRLFARPVGGGAVKDNIRSSSSGSWTGVIGGLTAGNYEVWAVMRTTSGGNPVDTPSVTTTVTVS